MSITTASERALLRSESGPGAGMALSAAPSNFHNRIDSHFFRVLLLRRLRLRLPPSSRFCRCGRPYDAFGHHRAACSRTGEQGRQGGWFAVESAAARVCREAGGRVATNVLVRDLGTHRIHVVDDGWRLWSTDSLCSGERSFAVDTTLVSAHHCALPLRVQQTQMVRL